MHINMRGSEIFAFVSLLYGILRASAGLSETHSLIGTYTAVNAAEFTAVLWLDGEEVDSYSSSGSVSVPRQNWMSEGIGRYLWMDVKDLNKQHWDRGRTDILRSDRRLNTSGAAVLQGRFGCEIERSPDSDIRVTGTFAQYGLNGEDFLSFSHEWESSAESAVPIKMKWNRDQDIMLDTTEYISSICLSQLKDVLSFDAKEIPTNDGVIQNMPEPGQGYDMRQLCWLLVLLPLVGGLILGVYCCKKRQKGLPISQDDKAEAPL
ncbi:hypothetical protein GJAV_G00123260 [Gymnothorax javanicus]|nr:hypothetical protein GJAV_G00123260 [Gymnothorax javanicus]